MMNNRIHFWKTTILLIALSVLAVSCNKEWSNKLTIEEKTEQGDHVSKQYKVAYIVLEGGVGTIVGQQATDYGAMPNLSKLVVNSVFTWNGISAANNDLATTYADMLTGVGLDKHQVSSTSSANNLGQYPTVFSRLKRYTKTRTALLTSNQVVADIVESTAADDKQILNSDQEVKTALLDELIREDVGFVFSTFSNVDAVGNQQGYDSDEYIQALGSFDQMLGEVMTAIEARPTYQNEVWLVVVTSNKGGEYQLPLGLDDGTLYSDTERNNFTVMYNNRFRYKMVERLETIDPAWIGSAVRFTGSNGFAQIAPSASALYKFGQGADAGDYTIQFKFKVYNMHGISNSSTPQNGVIMGNQPSAGNFPAGWSITYNGGNGWRFISNSSTATNYAVDNEKFNLDTWYTLTVKIYKNGSNRMVKIFRDGVLKQTRDNFSGRNLSNDNPFQIGYYTGSYGNNAGFEHAVADLRIYNTAIPDEYIEQHFCATHSYPGADSYHGNLIGYWPLSDNAEILADKSSNKRDFKLNGTYAWNSFMERSSTICPSIPANLQDYVIQPLDIPMLIYNWYSVVEVGNFGLDSKSWNPIFSNN